MADLVFIHGAGDSAAVWAKQVQYFERRHRVLALDLPGHGERLQEQAFEDHERNADEVARLLREHGIDQPTLVGHSMGGAVILTVAVRYPELPRALVLVASGSRLRMHPDFLESARQKAEGAPAGEMAGPSVPMETAVSVQASDAVRDWLGQHLGRATAQATYADFLANNGFNVGNRLGEIGQPTLVIGGEDDAMTPPKYQHFLRDNLPRAELVLIPAAGHYVQVEQAQAFNEALETFLAAGVEES